MNTQDILQRLGISQLTPMQEATARAYATGRDIVLLSPTGSGKTLAYLLPLATSLRDDADGVQAVILTPSRELALQTEQVFKGMGTPFKALSCYGGRPAMDEHRAMNSLKPAVIVGTPGRLNDHLRKQNFDTRSVRLLVIDEFDKCLELGFRDEMEQVVSQLPAIGQRILLSATDAPGIPAFTGLRDNAVRLDFLVHVPAGERLHLHQVCSPEKDKLHTLYRLLCTLGEGRTLVFVNYRESAERVAGYLLANKLPCDTFHGGMEQPDRERALYKFRNGTCPVLVATDLASRGLDIAEVDNVVHYHLPVDEEAYTHRNGRTARWTAHGSAYLLLHTEEQLPAYLPADTPQLGLPEQTPPPPRPLWTTLYIGKGKKDKVSKGDVVGFLCKQGGLAGTDIGQVDVKDRYAFAAVRRDKARQALSLIRGEKLKGMRTLVEEAK